MVLTNTERFIKLHESKLSAKLNAVEAYRLQTLTKRKHETATERLDAADKIITEWFANETLKVHHPLARYFRLLADD